MLLSVRLLKNRIAGVAVACVICNVFPLGATVTRDPRATAVFVALTLALALLTLRFGLLALIGAIYSLFLMNSGRSPLTLTLYTSAWYFSASIIAMATIAALAFWATRTALAGQPLFKTDV